MSVSAENSSLAPEPVKEEAIEAPPQETYEEEPVETALQGEDGEEPVGTPLLGGYMVFVNNVTYIESMDWSYAPVGRMDEIRKYYEAAVNGVEGVHDGYSGSSKGFGCIEGCARASGITRYPDANGGLGLAIRLILIPKDSSWAGWVDSPAGKVPVIGLGVGDTTSLKEAYHELAHILDGPENYWSTQLAAAVGVEKYRGYSDSSPGDGRTNVEAHGNFPTSYAETNPREDLAESVMVYFLGNPELGYENWADDELLYQTTYGELADSRWYPAERIDRYDFVELIFDYLIVEGN